MSGSGARLGWFRSIMSSNERLLWAAEHAVERLQARQQLSMTRRPDPAVPVCVEPPG